MKKIIISALSVLALCSATNVFAEDYTAGVMTYQGTIVPDRTNQQVGILQGQNSDPSSNLYINYGYIPQAELQRVVNACSNGRSCQIIGRVVPGDTPDGTYQVNWLVKAITIKPM